MLGLGIGQGVFCIAMGFWVQHTAVPSLGGMMGFIVVIAFFNECVVCCFCAASLAFGTPY